MIEVADIFPKTVPALISALFSGPFGAIATFARIPATVFRNALLLTVLCVTVLLPSLALAGERPGDDDTHPAIAAAFPGKNLLPLSYFSALKRPFYWAQSAVTFCFPLPEQATDLSGARLPAIVLTDAQKSRARSALLQWQEALASNPIQARRSFAEVPDGPKADIEIIVMPSSYFPNNVLGLTQTSWHCHAPKPALVRAVIWIREGLSDAQFEQVMLHEAGHAIMSADHSTVHGSVMCECVNMSSCKTTLPEADAQTVRENYQRWSQQ